MRDLSPRPEPLGLSTTAGTEWSAAWPDFVPRGPGLRNPHVQSIFASMAPRRALWRLRGMAMERAARAHLLDCGDGARLLGYLSTQPADRSSLGLVVLIHGWEGCHESAYLYSMACRLYAAGYDVFRLNLRDHGGTHALNEQPFHSARISDVLGALHAIRRLCPREPLFCVGFSLGGSFALRVALYGPAQGLVPDLCLGISPAINPGATLRAIDEGPSIYLRYFLKKWRRTLDAKARAWPGRFDFRAVRELDRLTPITARFAQRYTEYGSLEAYLAAYTLTPAMLLTAPAPVAVITAQDDPVIPFADFAGLRAAGSVRAFLAPAHGGHCGFIENWRLRSWAEARTLELLAGPGTPPASTRARA